jgi:hypothetical protein
MFANAVERHPARTGDQRERSRNQRGSIGVILGVMLKGGSGVRVVCVALLVAGCSSGGTKAVRVTATVAVTTTTSKFCYGTLKPEVPVPGFNPLTASDAELQRHDFPPRPAGRGATETGVPGGPSNLATWEHYARAYVSGQVKECIGNGSGPAMTGANGP